MTLDPAAHVPPPRTVAVVLVEPAAGARPTARPWPVPAHTGWVLPCLDGTTRIARWEPPTADDPDRVGVIVEFPDTAPDDVTDRDAAAAAAAVALAAPHGWTLTGTVTVFGAYSLAPTRTVRLAAVRLAAEHAYPRDRAALLRVTYRAPEVAPDTSGGRMRA